MKKNISRRKFAATSVLGLSGLALTGFPSFARSLNQNVRVGLIGVGQRGLGLANVIKKVAGLDLAACCDIVPGNLNAGMALTVAGSKGYTDYRKLLEDKTLDAVVIATPLYLHYQMASDAISANKHLYVEKTMTYDISQALLLTQKMKNYPNLVLQVGHQYRYYDMYPKIKGLIDSNLIGKVTHFESQYNRNSDWRRPVMDGRTEKEVNWRMYKEFSGGVMAELAAHQIDVINWLTNSHPLKVIAMGDVNFWKDGRTTFDNMRAVFDYPGGIKSSVVSILSNEYNGYLIRILGSNGTIELTRNKALLYHEPKTKELAIVDGVTGATKEALKKGKPISIYTDDVGIEPTEFAFIGFAESIKNKKKPISDVLTGKDTAIAVHLANLAAETGTLQVWKDKYDQN